MHFTAESCGAARCISIIGTKSTPPKHFKFCREQELKEMDFDPRLIFCGSVLDLNNETPGWHQKIVFSDEAKICVTVFTIPRKIRM